MLFFSTIKQGCFVINRKRLTVKNLWIICVKWGELDINQICILFEEDNLIFLAVEYYKLSFFSLSATISN